MKKTILQTMVLLALPFLLKSQSIEAKAEEAINTFVNQYKFTGSVLIANKEEIILNKGYGLQNAATNTRNSEKTIYQIASLTKQFTAAIILKLQELGKLAVSDKLSKYYPTYPNGEKITIHHLLSHTSGIYNYTDNMEFMSGDQSKPISLEWMINQFIDKPLAFEPGTKFSYSNSGYTLLGYIIEKVTGQSFQSALSNLLLKPLKLQNTGYDYGELSNKNKSIGYSLFQKDKYQIANYVHPTILYTTGAMYSTTEDLYRWHQILQSNSYLSSTSTEALYIPVAGPYGYGWQIDSLFGKKRVSHSGNVAGFKSNINRIPEDDLCIVVLSNSNSSQVGALTMVLLSILYNKPYQLPIERKSIELSATLLREYIGSFQFNELLTMIFTVENNKLFVQPPNQPKTELKAESEMIFFIKDFDIQFEFIKNTSSGKYDTVVFSRNKQILKGRKID